MTFKHLLFAIGVAAVSLSATAQPKVVGTAPMNAQQRWERMQQLTKPDRLVHPMGYSTLTPLTNLNPQRHPVATAQATPVRVAQAGKLPVTIYGSLVYTSQTNSGFYGIYGIDAATGAISDVHRDNTFNFNGGGIYADGKYNFINYSAFLAWIYNYDWYQYDTEDWTQLRHVNSSNGTHCMIVDGDHDATTGVNYAIAYNDNLDTQVFSTVDYENNTRNIIATLDSNFVCLAVSPEGRVYSVRHDGMFGEFNKQTGVFTPIGQTGVKPEYIQSAAIDPSTGVMYWAACSTTSPIGLYTIDLSTGAATMVAAFPHNEEFSGLYIPAPLADEDAPAATTSLSLVFPQNALRGAVKFTMPRKTYAGDDLSGDLTYNVYVNDSLVLTGTAAAGARVTDTLEVAEEAMYTIRTSAANSAGEGPRTTKTSKWLGYDQPVAPGNIRFALANNVATVTWGAPASTVHGGYFNRADLAYDVVRMPDSVTVATGITERTFTETLEDGVLKNVWYDITAVNHTQRGLTGSSNTNAVGSVAAIPYDEDFTDQTVVANMFTIIDANNDGSTWRAGHWNSGEDNVYYEYNTNNDADDWIITPAIHMPGGHFYTIEFSCNGSFFGDERLEAAYGTDKTVAAMTTKFFGPELVNYTNKTAHKAIIKVDDDANYYFGFHAISDKNQGDLELDDIHIHEGGVFTAPDTVTGLKARAAARGEKKVTLTCTAPTTDFNGEAIEGVDSIVVFRNGRRLGKVMHRNAGQSVRYIDTASPDGSCTYEVYTYNEHGSGIPATVTLWVGYDIPDLPTNVRLTENGRQAILTYEAPTTGVHGGYVNPSSLTYNIEDSHSYIKGSNYSGTTFTEYRDASTQDLLYYRVAAQSSAGGGSYAYSDTILFGNPYTLPFKESWANASTSHFWSQQNTGGQIGLTNSIAADNDNGAALFKPANAGDIGMITSGKIALGTATHPVVDFYYYAVPGQHTTLSLAVVPNGDNSAVQLLSTINYSTLTGSAEWRKASVDLSGYTGTDYVLLSWIGMAQVANAGDISFDAIHVHEKYDTDLSATLTVPAMVAVGQTAQGSVEVANGGLLAASDYVVNIYRNDSLIYEVDDETIEPDDEVVIPFDITPLVTDQESNTWRAEVVIDGDADLSNNTTETKTVTYLMPQYPAPQGLQGNVGGGNVNLTWLAPDMTQDNQTVESFEDYTPWIIDHIGTWTTRDNDGTATQSLILSDGTSVMYDHVGEPMAWQVFRPSDVNLQSAITPHTGDQLLCNIVEADGIADDWLISPQLSGHAQTVTFWARSMGAQYIESFDVLYSTTGTDDDDFSVLLSTTAPATWTEFSASLPEGTKYFAIRLKGTQKFMLMLDDITYSLFAASDLQLEGYNVYRNSQKVNAAPVATTSYTERAAEGQQSYRVSAVYTLGESVPTAPVDLTVTDGIGSIVAPAGVEGRYSIDGRKLQRAEHGVNILRMDDGTTRKVVVK